MPVIKAAPDCRLPIPSRQFESIDGFREELRSVCGEFVITPCGGGQRFQGSIGTARFGGYDVADIALDAQSASRDLRTIRGDQGRHLFFIMQTRGHAVLRQDSVVASLRTGDFFVCDSSRPCHFEFGGLYSRQISIHVRHEQAITLFGHRLKLPIHLPGDLALSVAMNGILQHLLSACPDQAAASALLSSFFSLFSVAVGDAAPLDADTGGILESALAEIERTYGDPDLSPSILANRVGRWYGLSVESYRN